MGNKLPVKLLLQELKKAPKKDWGQNFLLDQVVVTKTVKAALAGLAKSKAPDRILEIGPGLGILTAEILRQIKNKSSILLAVEKDTCLAENLPKLLNHPKNLKVVAQDIVDFPRQQWLAEGEYLLIANLPFQISGLVLNTFLTQKPRPKRMVIMLQREVTERVLAQPGDSARGLLSVIAEYYCERKLVCKVPKDSFWPPPQVTAAVIKLEVKRALQEEDEQFFKLVKAGFSHRRKNIKNSLAASGWGVDKASAVLEAVRIKPSLRAQDLSLAQWGCLFEATQN